MAKKYDVPVWNVSSGGVVKRSDMNRFKYVEIPEGQGINSGQYFNFDQSDLTPANDLAREEVRRDELLAAYEQELLPSVFEWAKRNGLADFQEQIRISLRVVKRVNTPELNASDWKKIFSNGYQWTPEERKLLNQLKKAGNELTVVEYTTVNGSKDGPKEGEPDVHRMAHNFRGSRSPYYLYVTYWRGDGPQQQGYAVQVMKRLAGGKKRRR